MAAKKRRSRSRGLSGSPKEHLNDAVSAYDAARRSAVSAQTEAESGSCLRAQAHLHDALVAYGEGGANSLWGPQSEEMRRELRTEWRRPAFDEIEHASGLLRKACFVKGRK